MARNLPSSPKISRTTNKTSPKVELFIVCEGKNTEPDYILSCAEHYGNGLVTINPIRAAGVPLTIIETALELREQLTNERKKSRNSFDSCFRVWAIFDRDEHPNVDKALMIAAEKKLDVAFSNPCFELWPLIHMVEYGGQDGRHALQRRLRDIMPTYDHEKSATIAFNDIKDKFADAYERAKKLNAARAAENCTHGCPFTNVGELVIKIIQNGKKWAPAQSN